MATNDRRTEDDGHDDDDAIDDHDHVDNGDYINTMLSDYVSWERSVEFSGGHKRGRFSGGDIISSSQMSSSLSLSSFKRIRTSEKDDAGGRGQLVASSSLPSFKRIRTSKNNDTGGRGQLVAIMRREGGGRRSARVMTVNLTWNDGVNLDCDSRSRTPTRSRMKLLYYPLYSGWSFPSMPHFFLMPGEACSWTLSRFKRDGLSNIWGDGVYPEFIQFVGVIVTEASSFQECTKTVNLSSQIERDFSEGASSSTY